jgi:hypothetical protein
MCFPDVKAKLLASDLGTSFVVISESIFRPSVTIISPNGGEIYKTGDTVTINWLNNNVTGGVWIDVFSVDLSSKLISIVLPDNSGMYSFPIPQGTPAGEYIVHVRAVEAYDKSDAPFVISNSYSSDM